MGAKKGGAVSILGGSVVGGFVGAVFSMPFDYVKSQVQSMQPDKLGKLPYKGAVDCARKTMARHGPARFYAGFLPYFFRQGGSLTLPQGSIFSSLADHQNSTQCSARDDSPTRGEHKMRCPLLPLYR